MLQSPAMKIWAISDLHLGFSTRKWMDIFGEHWKDHHVQVETAWRASVAEEDIVLVPGDLSWAMKPSEVAQDLAWFGSLPGSKVLVKGNHDYWWPSSQKKLRELLPPRVYAIKKRAVLLGGVPIIGVRGPDFQLKDGEDPGVLQERLVRERRELLQSIEDLPPPETWKCRPLCLFHYPPFPLSSSESAFTRILEDVGCEHCVFGHLHTSADQARVFQGEQRGVRYYLVSCDYLGFSPRPIAEVP